MTEFQRKFNSKILSSSFSVEALQLLLSIVTRIIDNPTEEKYKTFRRTAHVIDYLENDTGRELLSLLSFKRQAIQMEVNWTLTSSDNLMHAQEILSQNIRRLQSLPQSYLDKIKRTKEENKEQIDKTRMLIEEDRKERLEKKLAGGYLLGTA